MTGSIDFVCFSEPYRRLTEKLKLDVPVLVRTGVRVEEGQSTRLTIGDIIPLEQAQPKLAKSLRIRIPLETATPDTVDALHSLCNERRGEARVLFDLDRGGDFMVVMEPEGYNVLPDRRFLARVEELCGRGSIRIID
jgi:DNA polymerase III subunit alpha